MCIYSVPLKKPSPALVFGIFNRGPEIFALAKTPGSQIQLSVQGLWSTLYALLTPPPEAFGQIQATWARSSGFSKVLLLVR